MLAQLALLTVFVCVCFFVFVLGHSLCSGGTYVHDHYGCDWTCCLGPGRLEALCLGVLWLCYHSTCQPQVVCAAAPRLLPGSDSRPRAGTSTPLHCVSGHVYSTDMCIRTCILYMCVCIVRTCVYTDMCIVLRVYTDMCVVLYGYVYTGMCVYSTAYTDMCI